MSNTLRVLFDSIVRTIVPIVVGSVAGWAVSAGISLDPEVEGALGAALTAGFGGIYYIGARLLETYVWPKFGWLLLLPKTPVIYTEESPAKHSL